MRTQAGLRHLRRLHEAGHPDHAGIWRGWADHLLEECLEQIERMGTQAPARERGWLGGRFDMTVEHEAHLARVQGIFTAANDLKYRRGQAEHGGRLWEKPLAELLLNSLSEHIDGVNYTLSALEQLGIGKEEILYFLQTGSVPAAHHGA